MKEIKIGAREIKFRAWDNTLGKMVYDPIIWTDDFARDINQYFEYWQELVEEDERLIFMQYTGLKDKNGKEIYEGDIVSINDGEAFATVFYNKETACFAMMIEDVTPYYKWNKDIEYPLYSAKSLEVIGNIYDNPELLKGEQR